MFSSEIICSSNKPLFIESVGHQRKSHVPLEVVISANISPQTLFSIFKIYFLKKADFPMEQERFQHTRM